MILQNHSIGNSFCLSVLYTSLFLRVERITASGGEVGRLNVVGGVEVNPEKKVKMVSCTH